MGKNRKIAHEKLKIIERGHVAPWDASLKGIVQRFDYVPHVLSRLSKKHAYTGKEAMFDELPAATRKEISAHKKKGWNISPSAVLRHEIDNAHYLTYWPPGTYNCRLFFNLSAFHQPGIRQDSWDFRWGRLRETAEDPLLGIQLFDPNPKKLLEFAKAMAKRRSNNPISIIDLYGNVFYP